MNTDGDVLCDCDVGFSLTARQFLLAAVGIVPMS